MLSGKGKFIVDFNIQGTNSFMRAFNSSLTSLVFLYERKQTGPNSTPNSWSDPRTSTGAMSTIGIFATFSVSYSITVLPQVEDRLYN